MPATSFDYVKQKASNLDLNSDLVAEWVGPRGYGYMAFVWSVLQFTCHISAKDLPNFSHFGYCVVVIVLSFLFQLLTKNQKKKISEREI